MLCAPTVDASRVAQVRGHSVGAHYPRLGPSAHPSLFVGVAGSRSALHADSWGTSFWMAVRP